MDLVFKIPSFSRTIEKFDDGCSHTTLSSPDERESAGAKGNPFQEVYQTRPGAMWSSVLE
jgi:hypothetical protein